MSREVCSREHLESLGMIIPGVDFGPEIDRYELADRGAMPDPLGILFYGDSDIAFWNRGGLFRDGFRGLPVVNRGFGGARTWETVIYFPRVVEPYMPGTIVYCAGDNDLAGDAGLSAGHVGIGVKAFLDACAERLPELERFFYLAMHDAPARGNDPRVAEGNALVSALCAEYGFAEFLNYDHLLYGPDGKLDPGAFAADGLHFAQGFYNRWAAWLREKLGA